MRTTSCRCSSASSPKRRKTFLLALAVPYVLAISTPADAGLDDEKTRAEEGEAGTTQGEQDTEHTTETSASEREDAERAGIEEIVVTAQKRDESAQDVPIALQAITGEELSKRNVFDADDVLTLYPNLSINGTNEINSGFTIRGIGTNNFHGNVNQAVGVYYDEVTQSTPYSSVLGVFDMERVEILRGPQNTLFGRNTTGGAINYISRKPEIGGPLSGYGRFTYGSYQRVDLEGAVGVGLGERAGVRLAVQSVHRDAPFNNVAPLETGAPRELGARERTSGRLQLAFEPSSSVDLLVNVHAASNRGDSVGNKARGTRDPADRTRLCPDIGSSGDFTSSNSCVDINGANPSTSAWLDLNNVSTARADVDTVGGFLRLSADLGGVTLTSISSYDETEVKLADDIAGIQALQFAPHQDSTFEQFTQELRLVSPGDKSLRWILGAFYFKENLDQGTIVRRDNGGASTPGGEIAAFNLLDQEDEDVSGYGQLELDLTERLTLTGGLRYTHNDKSADSLFGVAIVPVALFPPGATFTGTDLVLERTEGAAESCPPGPPGVDPQTGRRFGGPPPCLLPSLRPSQVIDRLGGKLGLDYRLNDDVMLYAGYSRGFKSGGFDTRALAAFNGDAGIPVDPEGLNAYEVGLKSTWGDTLVLNGAAFYYDQRDLQTFSVVNGVPGFFNIPKSKVIGLELESNWAPSDASLVQAGLGLIGTEITDNGGLVGVDEEHVLPDAPKFTFNALIAQDVPIGSANLQLQADARYVGEQIDALRFSQDFVSTKEPQLYLNVRALLEFGKERQYELSVFGENLTGEKFCADLGTVDDLVPSGDDLSSTVQCQPGTLGKALWGVSLNARF